MNPLVGNRVLRTHAARFRDWLEEYPGNEIGYPEWKHVEDHFSELLTTGGIRRLDQDELTALLYLIARSWDMSRMIAWLSNTPTLSNLGDLEQEDFLLLARQASTIQGSEYDDARYQFAASIRKLGPLNTETESVLLAFYDSTDEYTKRNALLSLAHGRYAGIRDLIDMSWTSVEEEHHQIGCLQCLSEYVGDETLLREYLDKARDLPGRYLRDYAEHLRASLP
ncbi:hypothetical protein [Mycobacteroides salmoniphilum]|uniref:Uncharacterized protein n=1 Tax=Mycobacteroides salmoniphilum TaxID=404941 RepID=A0A4R8SXU5_9MYCO|nr:hypothetical protein [Mycobacteroides salmoniphilum]TEA08158.1 hypothetical protein CCUG60884_00639 [Mycobacteroides salmoniphilum]